MMKFASKMPVILLYVVSASLVAYSIGLALTSNFNMGNLMVWLLTAMIAAYTIWRKPLHTWFHTPGAGRIVWWCLLVIGVLDAVSDHRPALLHDIHDRSDQEFPQEQIEDDQVDHFQDKIKV